MNLLNIQGAFEKNSCAAIMIYVAPLSHKALIMSGAGEFINKKRFFCSW